MPQDIPLEASETLAFTPDAFSEASASPTFMLRAISPREKRLRRRLLNEEGAVSHGVEAMRAELLAGLRAQWSADACDEHIPKLEAYWQEWDQFLLQKKDDPDLKWAYDAQIEEAVRLLEKQVQRGWRPLARMRADNIEFSDLSALGMVAVTVERWLHLECDAERSGRYLTIDGAEALREALTKTEIDAKLPPGNAWGELVTACMKRMFMDEEEEGNSASPSPSEASPEKPSRGSKANGKSPASASSDQTLESA